VRLYSREVRFRGMDQWERRKGEVEWNATVSALEPAAEL
jgi:hypothetical protein